MMVFTAGFFLERKCSSNEQGGYSSSYFLWIRRGVENWRETSCVIVVVVFSH